MTPPAEIAVLDLAGTTVNDQGLVMAAFEAAMAAQGVAPGDERFQSMVDYVKTTMGASKIEVFTALCGGVADLAQQANQVFETTFQDLVADGLAAPIEGAEAAIVALQTAGIKVALTTGFSPQTRDGLITALGWDDLADVVLSPADVGRGRPYPDLALGALLRLAGTAVSALVTVGDTLADVQSGLSAGAGLVVGVTTGTHSRDELTMAGAHLVLRSVADLPEVLGVASVATPG